MARVTSYTVLYSPALRNSCCSVTAAGRCGIGDIFRRKTRARRASRRETRASRARDWRVGLTPASAATTTSCDSGRLAAAALPSLVLFSCSLQLFKKIWWWRVLIWTKTFLSVLLSVLAKLLVNTRYYHRVKCLPCLISRPFKKRKSR